MSKYLSIQFYFHVNSIWSQITVFEGTIRLCLSSRWFTSSWTGLLLEQAVTETIFEHWKCLKLFGKFQDSFISYCDIILISILCLYLRYNLSLDTFATQIFSNFSFEWNIQHKGINIFLIFTLHWLVHVGEGSYTLKRDRTRFKYYFPAY